MAPRPKQGDLPSDEEMFSDLTPGEDRNDGGDDARPAPRRSVPMDEEIDIEDDDLEIAEEEEEDPSDEAENEDSGEDGGEGDETETDDEGEEEEQDDDAPAAQASDFDPKDVEIVVEKARSLQFRKDAATAAKKRADEDVAAAKEAMIAAKEAGDSKADVAATERYSAALISAQTATNDLAGIAGEERQLSARAQELYAKAPINPATGKPDVTYRPPVQAAGARRAAAKDGPSKLANDFIKKNPWFNDPKYAKQKKVLLALDKGLGAEGRINKNKPEYFTELGRRFNREHPGLFKNLDGKPIATGQRQRQAGARPPAGGGGGNGGTPARRPAKEIKLTQADLDQMAIFGLNPKDKEARRAWLSEKRAGGN